MPLFLRIDNAVAMPRAGDYVDTDHGVARVVRAKAITPVMPLESFWPYRYRDGVWQPDDCAWPSDDE